jgi:hypothetical protein
VCGEVIRIKGCVGEHNYKYFLGFIGSHAIMCLLGFFVGLEVLGRIANKLDLWNKSFKNLSTGESYKPGYGVIVLYFFSNYNTLTFLLVLCLVMGVALLVFTGYHLNMVRGGLTTSENHKLHTLMSGYKDRVSGLIEIQRNTSSTRDQITESQKELNQINAEVTKILETIPKSGFKHNIKEIIFG